MNPPRQGISGRWFVVGFIGVLVVTALLFIRPLRARQPDAAARSGDTERLADDFSSPVPTFTAGQAALGGTAYANSCASCHGPNLNGGEFASALKGATFAQNWRGKSTAALFSYVAHFMPPSSPGSLTPSATAQLVAYLLEQNGVSASGAALPEDPAALLAMVIPRGGQGQAAAAPMMPLSPLAPPIPVVQLPDPLATITPVTDAMLKDPPPSEWLTWRRTYDAQGFSPLHQINRGNVGQLRVQWAWSLPPGPNEGTPLEHDGVLFIESFGDSVQALNAATGDLLWQYSRQLPADARPAVKRSIAIYREMLLVPTSDDHLVALDVKTGHVIWDTPIADYHQGWTVTGGPLVADGKVMQGITGQSPGGCWIVALDVGTGAPAWRFYTVARPGEPGGNSWNGLPLDKRSGASVWTAGSYDPALNLAYFGTGQTYDTGPMLHSVHEPGITNDGLYEDSTLALDPGTGKLVWHYQHLRNDQWDLDWAFEQQLIELPVHGVQRRLVLTAGKMAIYDAMDAVTGKYQFSKDLGIQNVVTAIDPATGEKSINPEVVVGDGKPHMICPHPGGGRSWISTSYDAASHALYVPMVESCMDLIPAPAGQRGNLSSGVNWFIRPRPGSDGKYGRIEAFNVETGKVLWIARQRAPQSSGVLATAGAVVFAGALDRYLKAYDAANGTVLWQVRLNDVPSSNPITYSVDGRQYLAVVVGNGGAQAATFPVLVPEIHNPPDRSAEIWVFRLPDPATR